ncbi:MAG: glucose-6-phosphate dehydrogenase assembly protein OpcA [Planctomycetota bacterium]
MTELRRQHADVEDLSDALAALWEQIEASDPTPLCRSLTANLIAVAPLTQDAWLRETLGRVLLRHHCRAFLILLDPDEPGLAAELAARWTSEGQGRQTVLEEISLRTAPSGLARAASTIRPLVEQDLTSHLFWAGPLPTNAFELTTMARLTDRVIVDSAAFGAPVSDLARLREIPEIAPVDLAWFRTRPWRRALAEAFERFSWDPQQPTTVRLQHGSACGAVAASLGLRDWLQHRLRAEVVLETSGADDAPDGEPTALELRHGAVRIELSRQDAPSRLRILVTRGDHCLLPWETPASRGQVGDLLAAAVDAC